MKQTNVCFDYRVFWFHKNFTYVKCVSWLMQTLALAKKVCDEIEETNDERKIKNGCFIQDY